MGPIERELRERGERLEFRPSQSNWLSYEAWNLLWDAELSLGFKGPTTYTGLSAAVQAELDALWPDVYSEAIEAAEALGL